MRHEHQNDLAGPVHFCSAFHGQKLPVQWYTLSTLFMVAASDGTAYARQRPGEKHRVPAPALFVLCFGLCALALSSAPSGAGSCEWSVQSPPPLYPGNIVNMNAISDESPDCVSYCPAGFALVDVGCTGRYCDNVYPVCGRYVPKGTHQSAGKGYWTKWFSDEGGSAPASESFAGSTWPILQDPLALAVGIQCRGDYCDEIRLFMQPIRPDGSDPRQVTIDSKAGPVCTVSRTTVSEEDARARRVAAPGAFLRRIGCSGSYCDNLRFEYCSIRPNR